MRAQNPKPEGVKRPSRRDGMSAANVGASHSLYCMLFFIGSYQIDAYAMEYK